ncbi:MAG TPA: glycine--tRNA ligase subunit beta [Stellaceae bacterium]|nr:glycine--tRNA ligase subunit beta [Stellaceae bacterium]
MAELLLELLTEEIPARMQRRAAEDLAMLATDKLEAAGLVPSDAHAYATPRRLTLVVEGLPDRQPDTTEERRGPRVGAPANAVEGFLKSAGLASIEECEQRDTGKGVFYFAMIRRPGRPTAEVLPALLRETMLALPWPKSMRFPAAGFRWVRPMTSALCLLGGKVLPLALDGVAVGNETRGHRFLAPKPFKVRDFADYRRKLSEARVMLRAEDRRQAITLALYEKAAEAQLTVKDDPALLDEVVGLVEWPVVLMGRIDPEFLDLPPEVLTTSMRAHQKYFPCLDREGRLAGRFLVVANTVAEDGGRAIIAGNERVLRARLSDARFFWEQDRKVPLAARIPKLAERIFHARLGSVLDKVGRVERLSEELASAIAGADKAKVLRAAELAKSDLSSGMVGEFPELQGVMGHYYALNDGEPAEVAAAIAEHYSPLGPNDHCPSAPVSVALALADKIDTLAGFFSIDEKPTGSRDPFALRRAALGAIRLILENKLRLALAPVFGRAFALGRANGFAADPTAELLAFFADRLKVHLREQGVRHDLIAAVFALGGEDDLVRLLARVAALDAFLATDDGANLLVAYRRAANIVRIEEKRDAATYPGEPDPKLLQEPAEARLAAELERAAASGAAALGREAFTEAMAVLAALRGPVDEFFAQVTVNCENGQLRANRLRLLVQIRDTLNRIADFSQIEG